VDDVGERFERRRLEVGLELDCDFRLLRAHQVDSKPPIERSARSIATAYMLPLAPETPTMILRIAPLRFQPECGAPPRASATRSGAFGREGQAP